MALKLEPIYVAQLCAGAGVSPLSPHAAMYVAIVATVHQMLKDADVIATDAELEAAMLAPPGGGAVTGKGKLK